MSGDRETILGFLKILLRKYLKMKKLFVIGNPIKIPMSPLIHNYWITKYLLNSYEKKEIIVEQLPEIIEEV